MDALVDIVARWWSVLSRRWLVIATWILAGILLKYLASWGAVEIATRGVEQATLADGYEASIPRTLAATAIFALGVTLNLVCVIGALLAAGVLLPAIARERSSMTAPVESGITPMIDAMLQALLPFLVFYGAWNLFIDDFREVQLSTALAGGAPAGLLDYRPFLVVALLVFAFRVGFGMLRSSSSRPGAVVSGVLEGQWMVFALVGVAPFVSGMRDWIGSRVFVDRMSGAWDRLGSWIPELASVRLGEAISVLGDAFAYPLIWLVIGFAALVGGVALRTPARVARNVPASGMVRVLAVASADLREKYVPMVAALGLIARAGAVAYLAYALLHAMVLWVDPTLARATYLLTVAPNEFRVISTTSEVVATLMPVLVEPVRIALLAAAVDVLLRRAHERAAGSDPVASESPGAIGSAEPVAEQA